MDDQENATVIDGEDEDLLDDATLQEMEGTPPLHTETDGGDAAVQQEGDGDEQEPGDVEAERPGSKTVPHAKFNELYQKNKTLEARANQLLGIIEQSQRNAQPRAPAQMEAEEKPDLPPEDPIEKIAWLEKKLVTRDAQERQAEQRQRQKTEQGLHLQRVASQIEVEAKRQFGEAEAGDPAVRDAYNYLFNRAVQEKMDVGTVTGHSVTQQAAINTVRQEEMQLFHQVLNSGQSVPETVRMLAASRGWVAPTANQPQTEAAFAQKEQRRGQHTSLSQMGGKAGKTGVTAKDLAAMDEDDFANLADSTVHSLMRA